MTIPRRAVLLFYSYSKLISTRLITATEYWFFDLWMVSTFSEMMCHICYDFIVSGIWSICLMYGYWSILYYMCLLLRTNNNRCMWGIRNLKFKIAISPSPNSSPLFPSLIDGEILTFIFVSSLYSICYFQKGNEFKNIFMCSLLQMLVLLQIYYVYYLMCTVYICVFACN